MTSEDYTPASCAMIGYDYSGTIVLWDAGATQLFGYTAADMLGQPITRMVPAPDQVAHTRLREELRMTRAPIMLTARRLHQTGALVAGLVRATPILAPSSPLVGALEVFEPQAASIAPAISAPGPYPPPAEPVMQEQLRADELRFRQMAESLPQMVWTCGPNGGCDYLSPQWMAYTGISETVQRDFGWLNQVHPDDQAAAIAAWHAAVESGCMFEAEFRIRRFDGMYRWFAARAVRLRDPQNVPSKWFGSNTDIQALREEQARLRAIAASAPGMIFALRRLPDKTLRFEYVSPSSVEVYGYTPEQLLTDDVWGNLTHPADSGTMVAMLRHSAATLTTGRLEYRAKHPERGLIWLECSVSPLAQSDGSILWHGFVLDSTERKQAEQLAQKNAAHLALLSSVADALAATRLNYNELLETVTQLIGTTLGEPCVAALLDESGLPAQIAAIYAHETRWHTLLRTHWLDNQLRTRADQSLLLTVIDTGQAALVNRLSDHPPPQSADLQQLINTMQLEHVLVLPLRAADAVIGVILICRLGQDAPPFDAEDLRVAQDLADRAALAIHNARLYWQLSQELAERRQTEIELRQSRAQLQTALEVGAMGVWTCDLVNDVFWVDAMILRLFNRSQADLVSGGLADLLRWLHPEDVEIFEQAIQQTHATSTGACEYRVIWPDGSVRWLLYRGRLLHNSRGAPIRILGLVSDITERRRFAEYQLRSQKIEALGTLAGGIAHDFNNLLMAIMGNAQLALDDLNDAATTTLCLDEIMAAAGRATDLVQQILAFSRPSQHDRQPIQLPPVVEEALRLMRATIPTLIALQPSLLPTLPNVVASASQIHQIIVNLVTNAAHAIGTHAGLIRIQLDPAHVSADAAMPDLPAGNYVRLTVTDNGSGMDQLTQARIFDPFFTTKPPGKGTGLGLSVVHGIVRSHGGTITVYSQPGKGTAFHLYFPCADGSSSDEQPGLTEPEAVPGHAEHIVYVDDEPMLIELARRVLGRLGYQLSVFTTPTAALEAFRANPQAFDLLITDGSMPEMSGFELAEQVLALRPDLPVVMTSGYLAPEDQQHALDIGIREVVLKPHVVDQFRYILPRLLARPG